MVTRSNLEAWQRGPIEGVPPLLMPAAHAVVHAREDAEGALTGLTLDQIWHRPGGAPSASASDLLADLDAILERAFAQIRATAESTLLDSRGIGRQQIPTTVIGLLFHAAEHAARHAGQALTTARVVRGSAP